MKKNQILFLVIVIYALVQPLGMSAVAEFNEILFSETIDSACSLTQIILNGSASTPDMRTCRIWRIEPGYVSIETMKALVEDLFSDEVLYAENGTPLDENSLTYEYKENGNLCIYDLSIQTKQSPIASIYATYCVDNSNILWTLFGYNHMLTNEELSLSSPILILEALDTSLPNSRSNVAEAYQRAYPLASEIAPTFALVKYGAIVKEPASENERQCVKENGRLALPGLYIFAFTRTIDEIPCLYSYGNINPKIDNETLLIAVGDESVEGIEYNGITNILEPMNNVSLMPYQEIYDRIKSILSHMYDEKEKVEIVHINRIQFGYIKDWHEDTLIYTPAWGVYGFENDDRLQDGGNCLFVLDAVTGNIIEN
ncbi:MAG: DUF6034 family protein [Clostridia bacterium]